MSIPPVRCLLLPVLAALFLTVAGVAQETAAAVDAAREALDRWVETRRLIAAEQRDHVLAKEVLQDRIAVVTREIETLRTSIADAQKSIGEAESKQTELAAERARVAASTDSLRLTVEPLESRLRLLLARVPDHLRERVKPLSQLIPAAVPAGQTAPTPPALGERYRNVIGVLNELDKFQRDVSAISEVRVLGDGATAEVTALYVGLGQAFYVNATGNAAGSGSPGADRWEWSPANDAAAEVLRAVKILKNEQPASFVHLPIRIR
ncbi:MAG: DUF3450 family protein [Planctomycetes bacterium]|nr:DUF3450 family protein [Planctomycetota bacterium]